MSPNLGYFVAVFAYIRILLEFSDEAWSFIHVALEIRDFVGSKKHGLQAPNINKTLPTLHTPNSFSGISHGLTQRQKDCLLGGFYQMEKYVEMGLQNVLPGVDLCNFEESMADGDMIIEG